MQLSYHKRPSSIIHGILGRIIHHKRPSSIIHGILGRIIHGCVVLLGRFIYRIFFGFVMLVIMFSYIKVLVST